MAAWGQERETSSEQRVGSWTFSVRGDEIADIRYDGSVVARSVRAVVRDRDWNTPAWTIERSTGTVDGVELLLRTEGFGMTARAALRVATVDGALSIAVDCEAVAEMWTNRTGLVVLHPPALAGHEVRVTHADGSEEATAFPAAVSPHQPVRDIGGLAWEADGLEASIEFSGDVFEMEDQRNWTDASYKTYSRPLDLPFPYRVGAGERVQQRVLLRARRTAPREEPGEAALIELRADGAFPEMQVGASNAPDPRPSRTVRVADVRLVELDLGSSNWEAALARAKTDGMPLDVRCVLSGDPDSLDRLTAALDGLPVRRIAAFDPARHVSTVEVTQQLRAALARSGTTVEVVGGARSHFTELNREQGALATDLDGFTFAVTPLFHALDTGQLVDSVAMQRLLAAQAVSIARDRPVHVGPVTLRPRFNDVATGRQPAPTRGDLSEGYGAEFTSAVDPRQGSRELAAWAIASAAALAVPGVASITWFEEWGDRGIFGAGGERRPVAGAIEALARLKGSRLLWGDSPDGLIWALGGRGRSDARVLVANLDDRTRTATVRFEDSDIPVTLRAAQWTTVVRRTASSKPDD